MYSWVPLPESHILTSPYDFRGLWESLPITSWSETAECYPFPPVPYIPPPSKDILSHPSLSAVRGSERVLSCIPDRAPLLLLSRPIDACVGSKGHGYSRRRLLLIGSVSSVAIVSHFVQRSTLTAFSKQSLVILQWLIRGVPMCATLNRLRKLNRHGFRWRHGRGCLRQRDVTLFAWNGEWRGKAGE